MDRVIASMSPDDTAAALRLLKVLEERRQMDSVEVEAEAWRRRITGWARSSAVGSGGGAEFVKFTDANMRPMLSGSLIDR